MSKVYVVCRGSYSDRYVDAVFDSEEKAKEYCDLLGGECDVEDFEMNVTDLQRKDVYLYEVSIINVNVESAELADEEYHEANTIARSCTTGNRLRMFVYAKDSKHAIKIASEQMMMVKARMYTHFPHINEEVVVIGVTRVGYNKRGEKVIVDGKRYTVGNVTGIREYLHKKYPVYDLNTFEIVLDEDEQLIEGISAATRPSRTVKDTAWK